MKNNISVLIKYGGIIQQKDIIIFNMSDAVNKERSLSYSLQFAWQILIQAAQFYRQYKAKRAMLPAFVSYLFTIESLNRKNDLNYSLSLSQCYY